MEKEKSTELLEGGAEQPSLLWAQMDGALGRKHSGVADHIGIWAHWLGREEKHGIEGRCNFKSAL